MERWEIQQKINELEMYRDELEAKITDLEGKKDRLELEQTRKLRQIEYVSDLYSEKRATAQVLYDELEGVALSKAACKLGAIYDISNEGNLVSKLEEAIYYLKKCSEKAESDIEEARLEISVINWQIYGYRKDLESTKEEV